MIEVNGELFVRIYLAGGEVGDDFLGGKHIELADETSIEKVTGAKVGFAGPVGIADKVSKMIIDHAVAAMAVGVTGA
ncbi:unnamed protein product, partial [marine sediment metagenome]